MMMATGFAPRLAPPRCAGDLGARLAGFFTVVPAIERCPRKGSGGL
jgi:hypothetical protein